MRVLPNGLHLVRLPDGDWIHARQMPSGIWKATAEAKVRRRVRTVEIRFIGSDRQLQEVLARAGVQAEVAGKTIGDSFDSADIGRFYGVSLKTK